MKKWFLIVFLIISSKVVSAQRKMLLEQIAALQVYIGYVQKGYSIAKKGLNLVGDIKKGELNLHGHYFQSLKEINPKIKNYGKVAAIVQMQVNIINTYKKASRQLRESKAFNEDELQFIARVFEALMEDCTGTVEDLIDVTTSNTLEMNDDERLKRIDALFNGMQDKYSYVQSFAGEAKVLTLARIREKSNIEASRTINGTKK